LLLPPEPVLQQEPGVEKPGLEEKTTKEGIDRSTGEKSEMFAIETQWGKGVRGDPGFWLCQKGPREPPNC